MTEQDGGPACQRTAGGRQVASIVLADVPDALCADGTRALASRSVCGTPAIRRLLETLQRCGIREHTVVVACGSDEVMEYASDVADRCLFAYTQDGVSRGEALRQGLRVLLDAGFTGDVLVIPCDRLVDELTLRDLIDRFRHEGATAALGVGDARDYPEADRVVANGHGAVTGIAALRDLRRACALVELDKAAEGGEVSPSKAREIALARFGDAATWQRELPELYTQVTAGGQITADLLRKAYAPEDRRVQVGHLRVPPERVDEVADLSVHLYQVPALVSALDGQWSGDGPIDGRLGDLLAAVAASGARVVSLAVEDVADVLCFASVAGQRETERRLFQRDPRPGEPSRAVRSAGDWLRLVEEGAALPKVLHAIYNGDSTAVARTRRTLRSMLGAYLERFGNGQVVLARSPGRVNLMGRHIDHQGGRCNMIAIDRDVLVVAGRRRDRTVRIHNLDDAAFPDRSFAIDEISAPLGRFEWSQHVSSAEVVSRIEASRGDWSHYVEAPLARLATAFPDRRLGGMNIVVSGSVPVAAGLSSSSALVVAVAEAVLALYGIECAPTRLADLCGEAEWYVGTRGGAGDHAAMKLARPGHVVQLGFLPLVVSEVVPMPEDHVLVVADSGIHARKTEGARDTFNHRVACYHIAREMLKRALPARADRIEHLRDVRARNLGIDYPEIVRAVASLPESLSRDGAAKVLPDDLRDRVLATHSADMAEYPVRGVALFGLSEIERSRGAADLLRQGAIGELGRWMSRSHDGDRVSVWAAGADQPSLYYHPVDDEAMEDLLYASLRREPATEMQLQAGAYGCSLPEIDHMVDIALSVEGVRGAQIAGAGLGGCMMALTRVDACDRLRAALDDRYYGPRCQAGMVIACAAVAGSGVIAA